MVVEYIKVDDVFFNYVGCHLIKIAFTQAWRAREASTLVFGRGWCPNPCCLIGNEVTPCLGWRDLGLL